MYLRNCWYIAAWDDEVGRTPFARTLLDQRVVLYRKEDGTAVALEDRCCHRNMPLSMGKVMGDNLRCGYHGLVYDSRGRCIAVPGQTAIPPDAGVRSYPVAERWRLLWIWMGDARLADPKLIPNWYYLDHPDWVVAPGNGGHPLALKCNYELSNDNLLDLTHVGVLHESRLGGARVGEFPLKTERLSRSVRMTRLMYGVRPVPIFAPYLEPTETVDRWQICEIEAPVHCVVDAGMALPGRGEPGSNREGAIDFRALISTTPETPRTSHLFYAQVRNFAHDDVALAAKWVAEFRDLFMEDVGAMEAQQEVYDRYPDAPTIDINTDAPQLAMRRLLRQLIAEESRVAA
jgi:phenylpropionate dioxygenase-like ring-hydroxylating dioxygenase large terminal subunit